MNIKRAYELANKKSPNVVFDYNGYYESNDSFVIIEDDNELLNVYDDNLTVTINKNNEMITIGKLEVFTEKFVNNAVYWKKENNKWTSMPAIETFE